MKLKNKAKKALGVLLAATMLSTVAASAVSAIGDNVAGTADFASKLECRYWSDNPTHYSPHLALPSQ